MDKFDYIPIFVLILFTSAQGLIITQSPQNASALVGTDVTLTCETSDSGDPDLIEWLEYVTVAEGKRIFISSDTEIDHPMADRFEIVGTYNLKIKNIDVDFGGKYACKLVIADNSPRTAYVSVFEPAQCANIGEDLREYDMAYISCYVPYGSEVIPDVYFYENGKKMEIDYERGPNYVYISTNITSMAEDDGQQFECRVNLSDPFYQDSCTTSLDIQYSARNLTFDPHYDNYFNGDSIECVARGNPDPSIEWELLESPGGEDNVDDITLSITPSMVGYNRWACHVMNSVDGNVTNITAEIEFEVLPGSTPAEVVDSATIQQMSALVLLATIIAFLTFQ